MLRIHKARRITLRKSKSIILAPFLYHSDVNKILGLRVLKETFLALLLIYYFVSRSYCYCIGMILFGF